MSTLDSINPLEDRIVQEPRDFNALLRREAPLYQLPNGIFVISRFEDVQRAVMDTETFSSNLVAVMLSTSGQAEDTQLLDFSGGESDALDVLAIADPPKHARHRRVANRAFTMRRVADMTPRIRQLAGTLVDEFVARGGGDWVTQVAVPLPMNIIVELLGFPMEDVALLKRLSDGAVGTLSGINTEAQMAENAQLAGEMMLYLGDRFDEAVKSPGDNVLGDLVRASREDSDHFSRDGVIGMLAQLLTAGNESTSSLISSAVLLLLRDEELQRSLRRQPGLIEAFIEETLRLETPFKGHFRLTRKDTEVSGRFLPAGSRVMLLWGSANRDEAEFNDADNVDLEREQLRKHMAFGYGIHQCIGAPLARAESNLAISTLLARTNHLQLAPGNDFRYVPSLLVRALESLRVACT